QRRSKYFVPGAREQPRHAAPAPCTMPGAVNQNECGHAFPLHWDTPNSSPRNLVGTIAGWLAPPTVSRLQDNHRLGRRSKHLKSARASKSHQSDGCTAPERGSGVWRVGRNGKLLPLRRATVNPSVQTHLRTDLRTSEGRSGQTWSPRCARPTLACPLEF